jgi:ribosomal protein L37AE/L43A
MFRCKKCKQAFTFRGDRDSHQAQCAAELAEHALHIVQQEQVPPCEMCAVPLDSMYIEMGYLYCPHCGLQLRAGA